MINLIIKGTIQEAYAGAARAGVTINIVRCLPHWPEVVATATADQRTAIGHWFACAPFQAPFPAGTLLWYGEAE